MKKVLIFFTLLGLGIGGQYLYVHKNDFKKTTKKKEINPKTYLKEISSAVKNR